MNIVLTSKFENGNKCVVEAFGINTYREVTILEVAATRDNKSFIYKIYSPGACMDIFNWYPEEKVFKDLYYLKQKWLKDLENPEKYYTTK